MEAFVKTELFDRYAQVVFGSPSHNAMSSGLLKQLADEINALENKDLRVIWLSSQGDKTFCAGADLYELLSLKDETTSTDFFHQFGKLNLALKQSPHLILTSVQGKAIGGAVGIIAASDYVIASDQASIRLSELINGIGPFVVGPFIERKIGIAHFNHLTLNPVNWYDAAWCLQKGLYNEVYDSKERLNAAISKKINELSQYSPKALKEIKQMMWDAHDDWNSLIQNRARISGKLILTAESKAALDKLRK